jgi:hypothetical protein
MKLLSTGTDYKTVKGEKLGVKTYIMYLSPFTDNSFGKNLCPMATAGCAAACLVGSGNGGLFESVKKSRRNKSDFFLSDRQGFYAQLLKELEKISKETSEKKIAVRLNGTSDIAWERIKISCGKNIMELFPNIQFYDYTKIHNRFDKPLPSNYYLVFSRSELNEEKSLEILNKGFNVSMVFDSLPETYQGFKVVAGDESDVRFWDEKGVIVGLKYKNLTYKGANNKAAFESGFAISTKLSA